MKKCFTGYTVFLLIFLACVFIFTACGDNDDDDNPVVPGPPEIEDPITPSEVEDTVTPPDTVEEDTEPEPITTEDETVLEPVAIEHGMRPIMFVHGFSGSASQFESQAQRFLANGYPLEYLAAYEYDTGTGLGAAESQNDRLNAAIDQLLTATGEDSVDLIGHSLGTRVSQRFLSVPENAAKVAHYVNVDGFEAPSVPGRRPTLALWGQGNGERQIAGAENDYNLAQSHIQVCTSAESFVKMYRFFNGKAPDISRNLEAEGDTVTIAGRANIFPANVGAAGRTLKIFEVDPDTGFIINQENSLLAESIGSDGAWGPVTIPKGTACMFMLEHDSADNADHYFYREPFMTDDYFIRLNTSNPGEGLGSEMSRSTNHSNLHIGRDKEMWGDQGDANDILSIDGTNVLTSRAAAQANRLSALFLFDMGPTERETGHPDVENLDGVSQLDEPNTYFHDMPFISALDFFTPAANPPDRTISIVLTPRGGNGATQTINVPNWPSNVIRSISVQFRDYVLPAPTENRMRPVLFVHGGAGSASQFESQAQRFLANGYPLDYLGVYEYSTRNPEEAGTAQNDGVNEAINRLLDDTGDDQVDLIGHSLGTSVSHHFLSFPENAAKVAHYVNVDGRPADALPGDRPTLALWGMGDPDRKITDARNDYDSEQSHIQTCTSAESFAKIYRFFTGEDPETTAIPEAEGDTVMIAGRANIFPENTGAGGRTLNIFEVDPSTGFATDPEHPFDTLAIGDDGAWGPIAVGKGVTYMFALQHETEDDAAHYFYREPFMANDYFIRLNTSEPGTGIGSYMSRSEHHTNLNIGRDKELWGDQGNANDILMVDGINVLTPQAAEQVNRLSSLFLFDMGPDEPATGFPDVENLDQVSQLDAPNTFFHSIPFISALDFFIPAADPPNRPISIVLTPRGGNGTTQTVNVPNWASDRIRSVSIQFRDFVRE